MARVYDLPMADGDEPYDINKRPGYMNPQSVRMRTDAATRDAAVLAPPSGQRRSAPPPSGPAPRASAPAPAPASTPAPTPPARRELSQETIEAVDGPGPLRRWISGMMERQAQRRAENAANRPDTPPPANSRLAAAPANTRPSAPAAAAPAPANTRAAGAPANTRAAAPTAAAAPAAAAAAATRPAQASTPATRNNANTRPPASSSARAKPRTRMSEADQLNEISLRLARGANANAMGPMQATPGTAEANIARKMGYAKGGLVRHTPGWSFTSKSKGSAGSNRYAKGKK